MVVTRQSTAIWLVALAILAGTSAPRRACADVEWPLAPPTLTAWHENPPAAWLDEPLSFTPTARPTPRLTGRLGAVLLQRSRPRSELLLTELGTGRTLLDPDQLEFPFRGGVDVGLLWHGTVADLEFRYFGVEGWNAAYGPVFTDTGAQLNIPDEPPFTGPLGARLFGSSSLQSFELNLRRNVTPRWTWLAGLRYLSFRDAMGFIAGAPDFSDYGRAVFGTTNDLYGLQIGADAILWAPSRRFQVEGAIKAGVYANGAGMTLRGSETTGDSFLFRLGRDHTAFVGDLNFTGVYRLSDRWALRAGYQLLWLSGVAAGSTQIGGFVPDGFEIDTSSTVFFHGVLLGIESNW
ncbi:MAG: hypothetical protein DWQ37_23190 [Planctomycetota bacterium]|nr:MAG: hypothetical protein DWQ37_23190 [Planctomycetota bacterium]